MSISAGLGIADFPFAGADDFWRWIDVCDSGGVDSVWQSDQIIGSQPNLDCMSVMAALAGGSKRLKFGMNVASLGLRDPVQMAKACATVDVLSDGRLLPAFGVGLGASPDFAATHTPTQGRGKRTSEALDIISRLWSQERVDFAGDYYRLRAASIAPRPVQDPLPLWVGGASAPAIERTARWGTGWQAGIETPDEVAPVIRAIKTRTAALGRSIDADHYGAGFAFRFGAAGERVVTQYNERLAERLGQTSGAFVTAGDTHAIMARLNAYHDAGVHKFVLRPVAYDGKDFIQQTRLFIERLLPEVAALNRRY